MKIMLRLIKEEHGQAVAEYAMLVTLISLITVTLFAQLGQSLNETLNLAASALD